MWRRERSGAETLRVGRHAVERWTSVDGGLSMIATQALPGDMAPRPQALVEAMGALYAAPMKAAVTVVIESAWLPVMRVDTGPTLLRAAQVEALVRHRFGMYESDHVGPASQWEWRIEHRAGTRGALAFGLPLTLKQTIATAAKSLGLNLTAMTPAFAWGWGRLRPDKAWPRATGWWLWPEQDRTLIARTASGETLCLNAGAQRVANGSEVLRLVEAESARWGVDTPTKPIAAARWEGHAQAAERGDDFVTWIDLRGRSSLPEQFARTAKVSA